MKIAISGGTGFVGGKLVKHFKQQGDEIYILTRNPNKHENTEQVKYVEWLTPQSHPEMVVDHVDVGINLAGESLNGRWTEERKKRILDSRINATREFVRIMGSLEKKPSVFINASAVGYYGNSQEISFTEKTIIPGNDFLAEVCSLWEKEADEARELGIRTVKTRFGLILDGNYGALPKIALPYKMMAGGPLGNGEQWMSWVHIDDVVHMIDYAIRNEDIEGPVNITAPNPKRNKDFGDTLSDVLNRPHWIPAPSLAIKGVLGEMSDLLLKGQYVYPKKLEDHGYGFQYPSLRSALQNIYKKSD
ncbi:TIGR01777 family protein [Halalkalibacillus sediminis]|uniref:TIGR01777 family protein n=1 Tax=Halalkalibacillus sediminis TaxID=2018042 RepID=A0A2I0QRJ5_9BACI|nr:TIGR01777 family oxidoreductase [Halalkalibacillus sediminis]PKR76952.1 TIGR01777 family protein [Halalkalibacillus sediminis]